jgi:uncharacterized phage-associated protein
MADRNAVCDYIILRLEEAGTRLNLLKLQKLMYYVQAWYLAFTQEPLFPDKFQAWVHGPVCRPLYDRFSATKSLYSSVTAADRITENIDLALSAGEKSHINCVLEVYAKYCDTQLEEMTHVEEPWIEARNGLPDSVRCEREISESTMARYYASRIVAAT